uniref:Ig-like domain-containing protein n=1 Tax=Scophthalmus maximus TaxID=52904 RepID=A0A8D3AVY8_SCOMX
TMTPPNFALHFTCLFVASWAHWTPLGQSFLHFESADIGESVTLSCLCKDGAATMFFWYKQTLGQKPNLVSAFYRNDLKISHLRISDSATYHCAGSDLNDFVFCTAVTVSVKGSGLNIQALVDQSGSETVQPGVSATLGCTVHTGTCDGKHSVYWFKNSEEPHPGLIYTHGDRDDQCERKPNTQTHSCAYNLSMKSLNLSHAGTFCAVASCGHVASLILVHFLKGALAFTTVLIILLAFLLYKTHKGNCHCTVTSAPNAESHPEAEDLHYATLRDHKVSRSR